MPHTASPTVAKPSSDAAPSQAIAELTSAFAAYNELSSRMQQSYSQLQAEVHRLRTELRQKNELLERKSRLAALGEMAAGMAHEIRNPLGAIQLYASLLQRDLKELPAQAEIAGKINNGVRSLDVIVNDILAFTQDQVCEKSPVRLHALLTQVVDYLLPDVTGRPTTIDLTGVAADLIVELDFDMMQRVFLNLIRNAVEALEGADHGCVAVSADSHTGSDDFALRICVADNGPGIEPELMTRIFNPFFTTKGVGTGLGLAIVHRLIESHNGIISVSNNSPAGATFTILLP